MNLSNGSVVPDSDPSQLACDLVFSDSFVLETAPVYCSQTRMCRRRRQICCYKSRSCRIRRRILPETAPDLLLPNSFVPKTAPDLLLPDSEVDVIGELLRSTALVTQICTLGFIVWNTLRSMYWVTLAAQVAKNMKLETKIGESNSDGPTDVMIAEK